MILEIIIVTIVITGYMVLITRTLENKLKLWDRILVALVLFLVVIEISINHFT